MSSPARLTILISGNGSNLQALIDASNTTSLPNTIIVRVISNRKSAKGLQRAEKALIPTYYHNLVPYSKIHPSSNISTKYSNEAREAYDADLAALVLENKPHVVVCAGWMHVLSSAFLTRLEEAAVPVINLHPALPGQFNGTKAIERAWEQGKQGILKVTGIMIHYVIKEVDCGEPIITEEIELLQNESLEELESRMHTMEHRLIVQGTRLAIATLNR